MFGEPVGPGDIVTYASGSLSEMLVYWRWSRSGALRRPNKEGFPVGLPQEGQLYQVTDAVCRDFLDYLEQTGHTELRAVK